MPIKEYIGIKIIGYHPISTQKLFEIEKITSMLETKNKEAKLIYLELTPH